MDISFKFYCKITDYKVITVKRWMIKHTMTKLLTTIKFKTYKNTYYGFITLYTQTQVQYSKPWQGIYCFLLQNLDYERFPRIYGGQLPSIVMESTSQSQKTCFKYKTYYDKQLPKNLRWPMAIFHTGVILFDLSKCVC